MSNGQWSRYAQLVAVMQEELALRTQGVPANSIGPEFLEWLTSRMEHYKGDMEVREVGLENLSPWQFLHGRFKNTLKAFFEYLGVEVTIRSRGQRFTQPLISYPDDGVVILVHAYLDDKYLFKLRLAPGNDPKYSFLTLVPSLTASASHFNGQDTAKHPARSHLVELALKQQHRMGILRMPKDGARYLNSWNMVVPLFVEHTVDVPDVGDADEFWLTPQEVRFCAEHGLLDQHSFEAFGALRVYEDVSLQSQFKRPQPTEWR